MKAHDSNPTLFFEVKERLWPRWHLSLHLTHSTLSFPSNTVTPAFASLGRATPAAVAGERKVVRSILLFFAKVKRPTATSVQEKEGEAASGPELERARHFVKMSSAESVSQLTRPIS